MRAEARVRSFELEASAEGRIVGKRTVGWDVERKKKNRWLCSFDFEEGARGGPCCKEEGRRFPSGRRHWLINVVGLKRTREGLLTFAARAQLIVEATFLLGNVELHVKGLFVIVDVNLVVELLGSVDVAVLAALVVAVGDGVRREVSMAEATRHLLRALRLVARALRLLGEVAAPATHVLHFAALEELQLFRVDHGLLNGEGILPRPLLHLLVHLGDLGGVDGPEAALALIAVASRFLDLLEALVQREVVPDRVLPAVWRRFEVRKMFAET
jgi:hypothetical protein